MPYHGELLVAIINKKLDPKLFEEI